MIIQNRKKLFLTSAAAVILSIASTSAIASAMNAEGGDDDSELKATACALIGCTGGSRVCGTTTGTIKAGIPPFVGEVSVSYTCYENPPSF